MPDTVETQTQEQVTTEQQATPDANQALAASLWGDAVPQQQVQPEPPTKEEAETTTQAQEEYETISLDEYFKKEFGTDAAAAKAEWETLRKLKETPPAQQEVKYVYDESREDEFYNYLTQKKQLEKLEKYELTDANQAAEIIKANLQFKYKDLSQAEIDRLFTRQYSFPEQPKQTIDQSDEDFAEVLEGWEKQVQEKQQDMIIDAKLAKPELVTYKSQIARPDIPQQQVAGSKEQTPGELEEIQKKQASYFESVDNSLKSLEDIKITYKDKEVELPLSFGITNDQKAHVAEVVKGLYSKWDYLAARWQKEDKTFDTALMAEDILWLENRQNILQSMVNDAAAKRLLHAEKARNNVNLKGVNNEFAPPQMQPKDINKAVADEIWKF